MTYLSHEMYFQKLDYMITQITQINVSHSTLNRIMKNHLKIKRKTLKTESSNQKRKSCRQSRKKTLRNIILMKA